MKLVKTEEVVKAAPSSVFLQLSCGGTYLTCDGSHSETAVLNVPRVHAAFQLNFGEILRMINRNIVVLECSEEYYDTDFSYYEFKDVIKAFGFKVSDISMEQLRIVLYLLPVIKHALYHWVDVLQELSRSRGSIKRVPSSDVVVMTRLGLISTGFIGSNEHMMLTVTGHRLALVVRALYTGLLEGAVPGQYMSDDNRTINYYRLWAERQGTVKLSGDAVQKRLDSLIAEIL